MEGNVEGDELDEPAGVHKDAHGDTEALTLARKEPCHQVDGKNFARRSNHCDGNGYTPVFARAECSYVCLDAGVGEEQRQQHLTDNQLDLWCKLIWQSAFFGNHQTGKKGSNETVNSCNSTVSQS